MQGQAGRTGGPEVPKHIVQKRGAATVVDLTVTKTNTYNPYVIMPVPDAVKAAGR